MRNPVIIELARQHRLGRHRDTWVVDCPICVEGGFELDRDELLETVLRMQSQECDGEEGCEDVVVVAKLNPDWQSFSWYCRDHADSDRSEIPADHQHELADGTVLNCSMISCPRLHA